jgi:sulfide:quinone oxidoreductase
MDAPGHRPDNPSMEASRSDAARVVVAGGGIAGIEAALTLRDSAAGVAEVTIVDDRTRFVVPATSTGRAFGLTGGIDLRLADVVARAGAALLPGRVGRVDAGRHEVVLADGRRLAYDALIVAVGARPEAAVEGASLTFRGSGADASALAGLIGEIAAAADPARPTRLAFVVPPGCGWPLAAYELALMAREHMSELGRADGVVVGVVTSERAPLALFGRDAAAAVAATLARKGVDVRPGRVARRWAAGSLELAGGEVHPADHVVALPVHSGPRIPGLPADDAGFIRIDAEGAVTGLDDVWAIGDGAAFPVKQGGLACRQADAVASRIAARLGADVEPGPFAPALRGWMWDGDGGRLLRTDEGGDDGELVVGEGSLWWPVAKVAGRHLAPFLHAWPSARPARLPLAGRVEASG